MTTDRTPTPPGNDISREAREIVERALFAVAANVAKHTIGRDGWHEQDECFKVDLREQQGRIEALIVGLQAERDTLKARAEAAEARCREWEDKLADKNLEREKQYFCDLNARLDDEKTAAGNGCV